MDNHPIPQDVTHIQFKLIGNLTLKQFGYVAAGGISAWIIVSTGLPFLIKVLIAIALAGSGLGFAFMPIEGRPADLMLRYFFQALFQPNQYLYQKQGGENALIDAPAVMTNMTPVSVTPQIQQSLQQQKTVLPSGMPILPTMQMPSVAQKQTVPNEIPQTIAQTPTVPTQPFNQPIQSTQIMPQTMSVPPVQPIKSPLDISPTVPTQAPIQATPLPTSKPLPIQANPISTNTPVSPVSEVKPTTSQPSPMIQTPVPQPSVMNPVPVTKPVIPIQPVQTVNPNPIKSPTQKEPSPQLQDQLQQTLAQKKQLEEQLEQLKKQLEQTNQVETPVQTQPVQQTTAPNSVSPVIKTVPMAPKISQAPMVSDFPNIIMGVVKDSRGNVLPNILIEVKDTDDNPVRAFKTNALGQFASATPLLNGTYTILFEDPAKKHSFDAVQIEATGEIMQPIEIISHDAREDLRKELFG